MPEPRPHVVIAGVSTRALATSAARAGYRVTAVDAFGDTDLRAVADVIVLRRDADATGCGAIGAPYSAALAAAAARACAAPLTAYTANFENHPGAVATLARGRQLLGNPPQVLERVRNPLGLMRALAARGFAVPATRASAPPVALDGRRWLLKPRRSGGGHGTSAWRRGRPVARNAYVQERIAGIPGSVVFAADGRSAVVLGLSRQLVGAPAFGAGGFRYCGSLLGVGAATVFERQTELLARATALAEAVTESFGLRGLNGLDFIARDGAPMPIEVNPRYSASMELIERAADEGLVGARAGGPPGAAPGRRAGHPMFGLHAQACGGELGDAALAARAVAAAGGIGSGLVLGKAIVYARQMVLVGDASRWTTATLADIPRPGERIAKGHPICTVFAEASDAASCLSALAAAADSVYRSTAAPARLDAGGAA